MPTLTRPVFAQPLHVGRPVVRDRAAFLRRVEGILDRGWLTNNGPLVRQFETRIAAQAGVRHAVAVCNATLGLQILVRALELKGEVIVPSLTFIATAHALRWEGLRPVFCDVDLGSHNLSPEAVERAITPRTSAILGVHLWGRPCDVDALGSIARRNGLALVFDAAHAFGCSRHGRRAGSFGRAEVFSFHATKSLQTFEGGAITTDDDHLADRLRLLRNFGFSGYDRVDGEGTNAKMSEIAAAMGLTGLEDFPDLVKHNRAIYDAYSHGLRSIRGLKLIHHDAAEDHNYHYITVEVDSATAAISRDHLLSVLHGENVLARRYFHPGCHNMAPYREEDPDASARLPVTEYLSRRLLSLPGGGQLSEGDVATVCEILRSATANGPEITRRLEHRHE
jgi:dTDP-4-amino-4,6-dideoxygalactose transaminase